MTSKRALVELIIEAESVNANEKRISFLSNEIEKDIELVEAIDYALAHSTQATFELPDGSKHACDMGHVEEFFEMIGWFEIHKEDFE